MKVGEKVCSKEMPELGVGEVEYVDSPEEIEAAPALCGIVTVRWPEPVGLDDWDLEDLEMAE